MIVAVATSLLFTASACKKQKLVKNETGEVSQDNRDTQAGIDGAVTDGNTAMSSNSLMNGRVASGAAAGDVCGASVDTTQRSQGILTLTFDGTSNCNGHIRTGKLKLTLQGYTSGKRWSDVGAVMSTEFTNYNVKRVSDNKSLTYNGVVNVTNVSGGNIVKLVLGMQPNVIHKVDGTNLSVKFDDGKISNFNLSRQYTHTYSNSIYEIKGEGTGTQNGISNIENWGTTREGDGFTSQVVEPVIWNSTCSGHKPAKGKLDIQVESKDFGLMTTLGVDASGNVVTSGCPWGYKVEWSLGNKSGSKLFKYQ
jgi:hypothetical protein